MGHECYSGEAAMLKYEDTNANLNLTGVNMSNTTSSTINRIRRRSEPAVGHTKILEGEALLKDMRAYRKKVAASPEAARKFLVELGVLTPEGKRKNLIRG